MSQRHPIQNEAMMLITTVTLDRKEIFADPTCAREACEHLYRVQQLHPFFLHAFVIMPDHCHFLLRIVAPYTIAKMMTVYKSGLTFQLEIPKMWQKRFHIRMPNDSVKVLEYIHWNPVKKGLCEKPEDYPWSSASGRWDVTPLSL